MNSKTEEILKVRGIEKLYTDNTEEIILKLRSIYINNKNYFTQEEDYKDMRIFTVGYEIKATEIKIELRTEIYISKLHSIFYVQDLFFTKIDDMEDLIEDLCGECNVQNTLRQIKIKDAISEILLEYKYKDIDYMDMNEVVLGEDNELNRGKQIRLKELLFGELISRIK
jgi:hypothetical protein